MNINAQNEITPQNDKITFEFEGHIVSIDSDAINIILSEINRRFILEDFSKYIEEKEVMDYFYFKEKSTFDSLDLNFKKKEVEKKFLKNFAGELIQEKYRYTKSLTDMKNKIDEKMKEIIKAAKNCKNINYFNLSEKFMKKFKTDKIPHFLEKNILTEIEELKLINELNQKSEKINFIIKNCFFDENGKGETLKKYYSLFLKKISTPFDGGNKKILFDILLYSNLKDIYKNPKIKEFFINNFTGIIDCFNYSEGTSKFEDEINKRKESKYINEKLKTIFKNYEKNDYHPYAIASYFFLVMYILKDENIKENNIKKLDNEKNNLNNPLILRILKNILYCFGKYLPSKTYNLDTYKDLLNYFDNYMLEEEKNEKMNNKYNINEIEKKIKNFNDSKDLGFSDEFDAFTDAIKAQESLDSISKNLNFDLKLIPLTKKRKSHTITILISGFLSQNDDIQTWKHFFNFDKENSDYYMFKWPSSGILSFIFKALVNIKKAADSFLFCYKKAEFAGRILALFLLTNEEFYDCQINLVGFSLGCHVLINFIKELSIFKEHRFMINNVLLMGGATFIEDSEKNILRDIFR